MQNPIEQSALPQPPVVQPFVTRVIMVTVGVGIAVASLAIFVQARRTGPALAIPTGIIHISSSEATAETRVPIENCGGRPLIIDRIESSCGCLQATPSTRILAPRERGEIEVKIALLPVGERSVAVTVFTNDATKPVSRMVIVAGKSKSIPFVSTPGEPVVLSMAYGGAKHASTTFVETFEHRHLAPWLAGARCSLGAVNVALALESADDTSAPEIVRRKYRVTLDTAHSETLGTDEGLVEIFDDASCASTPITTFRVSVRSWLDLVATPRVIRFTTSADGPNAAVEFSIVCTLPEARWTVKDIQTTANWIRVECRSNPDEAARFQKFAVTVVDTPTEQPSQGEILIRTSLTSSSVVAIQVHFSNNSL